MYTFNRVLLLFLFIVIGGVYVLGLFVDAMDVDASQYASISLEMINNKSWLQIKHLQSDYLDKPPLLFWLSALSMKLFGINNFAYKFPSFLFTILSVYSTYRLGKILYNKNAGVLSALLLASTQAYFYFNQDVRTDTILTACVIFSIWQLVEYIYFKSPINFVLGFTGIGLAVLTKGPIGLLVPMVAVFSQLIYKRDWKTLFDVRWFLGLIIVFVVISPALWGLYQQFDLHPEKIIFDRKNVSGIRFFLWDQSFGRITGTNDFVRLMAPHEASSAFFFIPNFLWSFIPWSIIAIIALGNRIGLIFRNKNSLETKKTEVLTYIGFVFTFIAMSLSSYKLPHYIFVAYPLVAIFTAKYILSILEGNKQKIHLLIYVIGLLLNFTFILIEFLILYVVFPKENTFLWLVFIIQLGLIAFIFWHKQPFSVRFLHLNLLNILVLNLILNAHFYPHLLKYQTGNIVGRLIKSNQIPNDKFYTLFCHSHSLDFYSQQLTKGLAIPEEINNIKQDSIYVLTNQSGYNEFIDKKYQPQKIAVFYNYKVTKLKWKFMNAKMRDSICPKSYLLLFTSN